MTTVPKMIIILTMNRYNIKLSINIAILMMLFHNFLNTYKVNLRRHMKSPATVIINF